MAGRKATGVQPGPGRPPFWRLLLRAVADEFAFVVFAEYLHRCVECRTPMEWRVDRRWWRTKRYWVCPECGWAGVGWDRG